MTTEEIIEGLPVLRPDLVVDIIERFPALRDQGKRRVGEGLHRRAVVETATFLARATHP